MFAEEKTEITPTLEEQNPLPDPTPTLKRTELIFKDKNRKTNSSSENLKSVRDSSGDISVLKESSIPRKGKEVQTLKTPPVTREPLDFRRKEKTDYVY